LMGVATVALGEGDVSGRSWKRWKRGFAAVHLWRQLLLLLFRHVCSVLGLGNPEGWYWGRGDGTAGFLTRSRASLRTNVAGNPRVGVGEYSSARLVYCGHVFKLGN
jgi:hypothetical protein